MCFAVFLRISGWDSAHLRTTVLISASQKSGNNMTGSELQKAKESAAEIMRKKQAAGEYHYTSFLCNIWNNS